MLESDILSYFVRVFVFIAGLSLTIGTVFSAIETFVVPRAVQDKLTRLVFLTQQKFFNLLVKRAKTYHEKDHVMAFFAPVSLLSLVPTWYFLVIIGYMAMFWAVGGYSWQEAFRLSGSSLLTLGFTTPKNVPEEIMVFSEAALGLILVAILIAYLPTMYAAFSRRESFVTMLEVRAGSPPSALEMLTRYHRIHGLDRLKEQWQSWEAWFADIAESHTSLPALVFFRSPTADHSWITAAGVVLDTAAVTLAAVDIPPTPEAALCIRSGYLALREIAAFFQIPCPVNPHFPDQPITINRSEFEALLDELAEANLPLKADREQSWQDFGGWRVNYDTALTSLANLVMAPQAPWSSDRVPLTYAGPVLTRRS